MMKQITIREAYDWITCQKEQSNGLTPHEWDQLLYFLEEKYKNENVVEYSYNKLRFINLAGVIQLKTVRIEILPKIDLHHDNELLNRRALLNMLSITKKLPIDIGDKTLSQYEKVDLLHILARLYVAELTKTLHRGIYREYRITSENIAHLKGRLLVSEHIRKNVKRTVHAYCEYDELTPNILINQVIKAALNIIFPYVHHSNLKISMMNCLNRLDEVEEKIIDARLLEQVELNRQNRHYEQTLSLAKAIIQSASMSSSQSQQIAFSFLFKINNLFEGYIGEILKRMMAATSYRVHTQHKAKKLLQNMITGRDDILLKPDVVIETRDEKTKIILDTKWKSAFVHYKRNYKQSDLYQMYAYVTTYQSAERCILLYPKTAEEGALPKWRVPNHYPEKFIEIQTVRLDTIQHTREDLEGILGRLSRE